MRHNFILKRVQLTYTQYDFQCMQAKVKQGSHGIIRLASSIAPSSFYYYNVTVELCLFLLRPPRRPLIQHHRPDLMCTLALCLISLLNSSSPIPQLPAGLNVV